jgi:WD40 repeat protein
MIWGCSLGHILPTDPKLSTNHSVAWSPGGSRLAVGGDLGVFIYSETLTEVARSSNIGSVSSITWNSDGSLLAANIGNAVLLLDGSTLTERNQLPIVDSSVIAWSPDGSMFASDTGKDDSIRIWGVSDNGKNGFSQEINTLRGHTAWVRFLAWSPDSRRLMSASGDGTVRVWDIETGQPLSVFRHYSGNNPKSYPYGAWNPNNIEIASTIDNENAIWLWDATTGQLLNEFQGKTDNHVFVRYVDWKPDGSLLAVENRNEIQIWDITTGQIIQTLSSQSDNIGAIAWSPDGSKLVAVGSIDNNPSVWLWGATTGELLASVSSK